MPIEMLEKIRVKVSFDQCGHLVQRAAPIHLVEGKVVLLSCVIAFKDKKAQAFCFL